MPDKDRILLNTKLHRPPLPHDLVERSRLVELLDTGIESPLTLVCAPAGFGKSTMVSTWLERMAARRGEDVPSLPFAWISLDENDSDLNLFISYFIGALRTIISGACSETLALLQAQRQPPPAVLYAKFSNELDELPGEYIIVLDDYHFIRGKAVHNLLIEILRHWPKPLHLVLISRMDPPLPLINLRAKKMIREIRTHDLRFTSQETGAYLDQAHFASLNQETRSLLEERFEGWIAGLHLAALSLRSKDRPDSIPLALIRENPNITGYLMEEVLTRQVPAINSFLLKTSALDRFCASLCEAVIGETDPAWNARRCLDWIERSELFIVPLDNHHEWYRYDHLFQEFLKRRLTAGMTLEQVSNLHRQASTWFEAHGLLEEALEHAIAAGDFDLVAHQMTAGLRDVVNREDRPTLERWLRILPEEIIQQQPGLLMIRIWVLQFTWRLDLQVEVLKQVEALLESGGGISLRAEELKILHGQIMLVKAEHAFFRNQVSMAIDLCRQAFTLLPPSWTFGRGAGMLYLGLSMQADGQGQEAEKYLLAEYDRFPDKSNIYALFILESLCFIYQHAGKLEQSNLIAQVLIQGAIRSEIAYMKSIGDWMLGMAYFQQNELDSAEKYFIQIFENHFTAPLSTYRDAVAGLALIHQIKGESTEAWQMLGSISTFDLELSGSEDERTRSLRARLMLLQGDLEGAGRWADPFTNSPPNQPFMWLEEPNLTHVRILVARGSEADLHLALQLIDRLEEIADRTHNTWTKIEILALRSLVMNIQGKTSKAIVLLKQAVDLAQPGRFIRVFVDLGKPMRTMLRRLARQDNSTEKIQRILAAFSEHEKKSATSSGGVSTLTESLTQREQEVLVLLQGPASIKEIAQKLNISYGTAKGHTIKIYDKLGVNRRWNAVAKAEELNILPPR